GARLSYNQEGKDRFKEAGIKAITYLARKLKAKEYTVDFNMSGIAGSGYLTAMIMFTDEIGIYFSIQQDELFGREGENKFLYRTITHLKDYSGGGNNYMDIKTLKNFSEVKRLVYRLCRITDEDIKNNKPKNGIARPLKINSKNNIPADMDNVVEIYFKEYCSHLFGGRYFALSDDRRATDLAHLTAAFQHLTQETLKMSEDEFWSTKFKFESGQSGTPSSLMGCYHSSIYDVMSDLLGLNEEYCEEEIEDENF
ncbi:MAG TPA: hypothetical protein VLB82_09980, partial [Thermodesulfobacteriota bacterium]|nr:hypothetical protein [Thermodesulfobacteriota bacterium]